VPWNTIGVLKQLRPDVIISGELGFRSVFSAMYTTLVRRTPLVLFAGLSEHTEQGRGRLRRSLRKWLVKRADCVAVNGASGGRYIERLGFDPRRICRVHYPTLPGVFDQLPTERDVHQAHRLLFVGQLIERKGVLPFTEALARWAARHPDRNVEFTLAGYGPLQAALESLDRPDNLSLHVLGQCNYEQIAECYASAGIFAFPSLADDWGMAVNEAMAAGLPVLGSIYSQAAEEMCVAGDTGWPFRADDVKDMERAIDAALSTPPDKLHQMRIAARARVAQMTPAAAADDLVDAIRVALQQRASKGTSH
jgi:glycosyltransferase involved in cell wall biosynthesis